MKQTDPLHCARALTGRLREKQEMGEEAVVQVSDNCGLDQVGAWGGEERGQSLEICRR